MWAIICASFMLASALHQPSPAQGGPPVPIEHIATSDGTNNATGTAYAPPSHDTSPFAAKVPAMVIGNIKVYGLEHIRPAKFEANSVSLVVFLLVLSLYTIAAIVWECMHLPWRVETETAVKAPLAADAAPADAAAGMAAAPTQPPLQGSLRSRLGSLRMIFSSWRRSEAASTAPSPSGGPIAPNVEMTPSQASPPVKVRFDGLDFLRFIYILIVVYGHFGYQLAERDQYIADMIMNPSQQWVALLQSWPWMWLMSGFSFISGAVCHRAQPGATIAKLVVVLAVTFVMMNALTWLTPGRPKVIVLVPYYLWFLISLAVWQVTITPFFVAGRAAKISSALLLAAVYLVSYLLHHGLEHQVWSFSTSFGKLWGNTWTLAPFYAIGQTRTANEWMDIFRSRRVIIVAVVYFAAWHVIMISLACHNPMAYRITERMTEYFDKVGVAFDEQFHVVAAEEIRSWWLNLLNDLTMWFEVDMDRFLDTAIYPHAWAPKPVSFGSLCTNLTYFVLKTLATLSVAISISSLAAPLKWLCPCIADIVFSCGRRVIYCYILHFWLLEAAMRMGTYLLLQALPIWLLALVGFLLSIATILLLCCSLTEKLFSKLLMAGSQPGANAKA